MRHTHSADSFPEEEPTFLDSGIYIKSGHSRLRITQQFYISVGTAPKDAKLFCIGITETVKSCSGTLRAKNEKNLVFCKIDCTETFLLDAANSKIQDFVQKTSRFAPKPAETKSKRTVSAANSRR